MEDKDYSGSAGSPDEETAEFPTEPFSDITAESSSSTSPSTSDASSDMLNSDLKRILLRRGERMGLNNAEGADFAPNLWGSGSGAGDSLTFLRHSYSSCDLKDDDDEDGGGDMGNFIGLPLRRGPTASKYPLLPLAESSSSTNNPAVKETEGSVLRSSETCVDRRRDEGIAENGEKAGHEGIVITHRNETENGEQYETTITGSSQAIQVLQSRDNVDAITSRTMLEGSSRRRPQKHTFWYYFTYKPSHTGTASQLPDSSRPGSLDDPGCKTKTGEDSDSEVGVNDVRNLSNVRSMSTLPDESEAVDVDRIPPAAGVTESGRNECDQMDKKISDSESEASFVSCSPRATNLGGSFQSLPNDHSQIPENVGEILSPARNSREKSFCGGVGTNSSTDVESSLSSLTASAAAERVCEKLNRYMKESHTIHSQEIQPDKLENFLLHVPAIRMNKIPSVNILPNVLVTGREQKRAETALSTIKPGRPRNFPPWERTKTGSTNKIFPPRCTSELEREKAENAQNSRSSLRSCSCRLAQPKRIPEKVPMIHPSVHITLWDRERGEQALRRLNHTRSRPPATNVQDHAESVEGVVRDTHRTILTDRMAPFPDLISRTRPQADYRSSSNATVTSSHRCARDEPTVLFRASDDEDVGEKVVQLEAPESYNAQINGRRHNMSDDGASNVGRNAAKLRLEEPEETNHRSFSETSSLPKNLAFSNGTERVRKEQLALKNPGVSLLQTSGPFSRRRSSSRSTTEESKAQPNPPQNRRRRSSNEMSDGNSHECQHEIEEMDADESNAGVAPALHSTPSPVSSRGLKSSSDSDGDNGKMYRKELSGPPQCLATKNTMFPNLPGSDDEKMSESSSRRSSLRKKTIRTDVIEDGDPSSRCRAPYVQTETSGEEEEVRSKPPLTRTTRITSDEASVFSDVSMRSKRSMKSDRSSSSTSSSEEEELHKFSSCRRRSSVDRSRNSAASTRQNPVATNKTRLELGKTNDAAMSDWESLSDFSDVDAEALPTRRANLKFSPNSPVMSGKKTGIVSKRKGPSLECAGQRRVVVVVGDEPVSVRTLKNGTPAGSSGRKTTKAKATKPQVKKNLQYYMQNKNLIKMEQIRTFAESQRVNLRNRKLEEITEHLNKELEEMLDKLQKNTLRDHGMFSFRELEGAFRARRMLFNLGRNEVLLYFAQFLNRSDFKRCMGVLIPKGNEYDTHY